MAEIERNRAREDSELRCCSVCGAEQVGDDPVCPRGAVGCEIYTLPPRVGADPS
jgi:hypothetical protein